MVTVAKAKKKHNKQKLLNNGKEEVIKETGNLPPAVDIVNGQSVETATKKQTLIKLKVQKKNEVIDENSFNVDQLENSPATTDTDNEESNASNGKLVTKAVTKKKKPKKPKGKNNMEKEVIDEISFNVDQLRNPLLTTGIDEESNTCNGKLVTKAVNKKKIPKKQKVQTKSEIIDENSFNVDQLQNSLATTNIDNEESNASNGKLVTKAATKQKKPKKPKGNKYMEEEVIGEISFNVDQLRNSLLTTDIDDEESSTCNGKLLTKAVSKKKKPNKLKVQKKSEVIEETSFNVDQLQNSLARTDTDNEESNASNGRWVTKAVTKKKKPKKPKGKKNMEKEVIDEISFNVDQLRNPLLTTDFDDEESNTCNGKLVTKAVSKKKKPKKQKVQTKSEVIEETSFNVDQLQNSLATTDIDDANDESNVCNGELVTKAVTKKKLNKRTSEEQTEEPVSVGSPFNIDQFRNPLEEEQHWGLRREFLEKNQHVLPLDELVTLAQVYMNVHLLGCRYVPETMKIVEKLSEGLGRDYHRSRAFMLKRTYISASDAAACKVRKLDQTVATKPLQQTSSSVDAADQSIQGSVPSYLLNRLRSDLIILHNDMYHTMNTFNLLNKDMKIVASVSVCQDDKKYEGCVKVGDFEIAKATNNNSKRALHLALENAKEFLRQYCYSITRKSQRPDFNGEGVVSKSEILEDEAADDHESTKLDTENVGFKLLEKLGWNGGGLGVRGNGILDPLTVDQNQGRKGLGSNVKIQGKLNRKIILQKLQDLQEGKIRESKIVFSSECSLDERKLIHLLAARMKLKSQSYGKESKGGRYLVVSRKDPPRPTELLKKVLVEKDQSFCALFDVMLPGELK